MGTETLRYTYDENYISLHIPDPYSRKGVTVRKIKHDNSILASDVHLLATAWIHTVTGYPLTTTIAHTTSLKSIINFLTLKKINLPNDDGWQNFTCDYFEFFLTSEFSSTSTLKTRMNEWSMCNSLLTTMKTLKTIPEKVLIPQSTLKGRAFKCGPDTKNYVVGEKITAPTEYAEADNGFFCVDLTYSLDSDNYFEKLSQEITKRLDLIQSGADAYWQKVKSYHQLGKELIGTIDESEFMHRLSTKDFLYTTSAGKIQHLIHSKDGISWLLKFLQHSLSSENPLKISMKDIIESTFFMQLSLKKTSIYTIINGCIRTIKPNDELECISINEFLTKLLGLLNHRDCACLATILIHEHPELTSTAITNANISSSRGKTFLYPGNTKGRLILSVSKPRASKRINSVLTERAKKVLEDIIQLTALIRRRLKSNGLAHRRLFLTSTKYGSGAATNVVNIMNSSPQCVTLYEVLSRYVPLPFDKATFSLSRIRNSQGILTWLKNGSAEEMAVRLSNTPGVILRHYLPAWLVTKWNERTIRRYQQTLILLAAYKSPWLLDATEFRTKDELLAFVNSIVSSSTTGDPLGDLIQRRLGPLIGGKPINEKMELMMKLSADSLYSIFSCTESTKTTAHESAIHSLSNLIKETFNTTIKSPAEHAIRSKMQGDYFDNFKKIYFEAIAKINNAHNLPEA